MTISSAKSKGRRHQHQIRDLLLEKTKSFGLVHGDITSVPGGVSGRDINLSPRAEGVIKWNIEAKNQENINLYKCIEQAEYNSKQGRIPLLVFTKNRSKKYVCILENDLNIDLKDKFYSTSCIDKKFNIWKMIDNSINKD